MAKKAASKKNGESLSAIFRAMFREHPEWLELDRNGPILDHWAETHNGEQMDKRTMQVMSNIKSLERKRVRGGEKGGTAPSESTPPAARKVGPKTAPKAAKPELEHLEVMIDNCLSAARSLDVEKLEEVIQHLRVARNSIVRMFMPA